MAVLQCNRLRWYGHVLRKDDNMWVKKCTDFEVAGVRPRGRPKRTWKEAVEVIVGVNVSDCFWYRLTRVILD